MRVTTAFKRLLDLKGITVTEVEFGTSTVVVSVRLRSGKLHCPWCSFTSKARYDRRQVASRWRHLDLGRWRLQVRAELRRLRCPDHGVVTEAVPFARAGSRFTRDFEDLTGWLATTMDKSALSRLLRIDWDTVGRIIERVMATELDPDRLDRLFSIGVDEVSWRKGHSYLTLVSDHDTGRFVWGHEGKDTATLDEFFDDLGPERGEQIQAVSMDMGPAFAKSATAEGHATKAIICYDPFHVVQLATKALETVRRGVWQELRKLPDQNAAKKFKGARWALLKNPSDLTDEQAATLRKLKRRGGDLWRAYALKEALRAVFAGDLDVEEVGALLDRFCSKASRSRLKPFVTVAKTIRKRREGILAAVRLGINNAQHEGLIIWSGLQAVTDVVDGAVGPCGRHVLWTLSSTSPTSPVMRSRPSSDSMRARSGLRRRRERDEGSACAHASHIEGVLDGRGRRLQHGRGCRALLGALGRDRTLSQHDSRLRAQPGAVVGVPLRGRGLLVRGGGGGRLAVRHLATGPGLQRHRPGHRHREPGRVDGQPAPGGGLRLLRLPHP